MADMIAVNDLTVATQLKRFIDEEALPGTGLAPDAFWSGLSAVLNDLAPKNRALIAKREDLQQKIDAFHVERRGKPIDPAEYRAFLDGRGVFRRDRQCGRRDRGGPGSPAGRSPDERPLYAERRQCPVGLPL